MPFLAVDATIGNQFSLDRCNIFPGLSYNKANNTFLNSLRKKDVEAKVELTSEVMEKVRVTCYSVTKESLPVYVLKFFGI